MGQKDKPYPMDRIYEGEVSAGSLSEENQVSHSHNDPCSGRHDWFDFFTFEGGSRFLIDVPSFVIGTEFHVAWFW